MNNEKEQKMPPKGSIYWTTKNNPLLSNPIQAYLLVDGIQNVSNESSSSPSRDIFSIICPTNNKNVSTLSKSHL